METSNVDTYGRHAARPGHPAGLDGIVFGRHVRYPWGLFVADRPEGLHHANSGRPAGVYFERRGVVHHTGHLDGYRSVRDCLRFGEKRLPRLRSLAKELTSRK